MLKVSWNNVLLGVCKDIEVCLITIYIACDILRAQPPSWLNFVTWACDFFWWNLSMLVTTISIMREGMSSRCTDIQGSWGCDIICLYSTCACRKISRDVFVSSMILFGLAKECWLWKPWSLPSLSWTSINLKISLERSAWAKLWLSTCKDCIYKLWDLWLI